MQIDHEFKSTPAIKVCFDSQIFLLQVRGGISKYFSELIKIYGDHPELGIHPVLNFKYTINHHLIEALPSHNLKLVTNPLLKVFLKYSVLFGITRFPKNINIIHHTYYARRIIIRDLHVKTVSTLYDMIPEILKLKSKFLNPHLFKIKYLEKSDGVISISKEAIRQYQEIAKNPRTDIVPIHLGSKVNLDRVGQKPNWIPKNFFLYVGGRSGYKRADVALQAFVKLKSLDNKLVFVGGGNFTKAERKFISDHNLENLIIHQNVSDSELIHLYQNAKALIVTSELEGFGLPLVEAALNRCPLIVSSSPVFKEIMGNNALFFSNSDTDELAKLIDSLNNGSVDVIKLKSNAFEKVSNLTWFTCAKATAKFYKDIQENPILNTSRLKIY